MRNAYYFFYVSIIRKEKDKDIPSIRKKSNLIDIEVKNRYVSIPTDLSGALRNIVSNILIILTRYDSYRYRIEKACSFSKISITRYTYCSIRAPHMVRHGANLSYRSQCYRWIIIISCRS